MAAWTGVILLATSVPLPFQGPDTGLPLDKVAHLVLYGVLGWLAARSLRREGRLRPPAAFLCWFAVLLFAALDEYHQLWIPGREAAVDDWIVDVLAAGAGILAYVATRGRGNGERGEAYARPGAEGRGDETGDGTGER